MSAAALGQPCEPTGNGQACLPISCPFFADECLPSLIHYDPASGAYTIVECECQDPDSCRVEVLPWSPPSCYSGDCPPCEACAADWSILPDWTWLVSCDCEYVVAPSEACCWPTGDCTDLDPCLCADQGGVPQGVSTACTQPEACCLPDGTCAEVDPICCDDLDGTSQGPGTACSSTTIACCLPGGGCADVDPLCCDDLGGWQSPIGELMCLGDGDGDGVDEACEQPCQPTPDALACEPVACPHPQECVPTVIRFGPAPDEYSVLECECMDPDDCQAHVEEPICGGDCPPCDSCAGSIVINPDGSNDHSCFCIHIGEPLQVCCWPGGACTLEEPCICSLLGGWPSPTGEPACLGDMSGNGVDDACEQPCEPTPNGLACEPVICPDPTEVCYPKVVRRNVPSPFFPLGGVDVLAPTTGWIQLEDPQGAVTTFTITGEEPNITRVLRQDPQDEATIRIDILTDNYPNETTWEIVEHGNGVVASGGPLSEPLELYTWDVPVASALCYDFTIFDSFGDGICPEYGQGEYEVYYQGILVGSGCEFDYWETVPDIGIDCGGGGGRVLISQLPNQADGIFSDCDCALCLPTEQKVLAEQFTLTNQETINQIRAWIAFYPGNISSNPDDMTVIFHEDAGGLPGASISVESDVPSTRVETGVVLFGANEWLLTLTLQNPVTLGAGTHWVEVFNNTVNNPDQMFWETGNPDPVNGIPGLAFAHECPGVSWTFDLLNDLAFELITFSSPANTIATEIVEMELVAGGGGGGVFVHRNADPAYPSTGWVVGASDPSSDYPADSFFDIYVTVDIPDIGVSGLWHDQPIRLESAGITAVPPWSSAFETPVSWPGIELLDVSGAPTGYRITQVVHQLPPPPPEWEVIECECMDPNGCHVDFAAGAEPTSCLGGCPSNEECGMLALDTDGDGITDWYECQCELPTPGNNCDDPKETAPDPEGTIHVSVHRSGPPEHQVFMFDMSGTVIGQYPQIGPAAADPWGYRDGCSDDEYVYFGWGDGIARHDCDGQNAVWFIAGPAPGGVGTWRALAYDPTGDGGNGSFWAANWGSPLIEVDMSGLLLTTCPNTGGWSLYGLAYDDRTGMLWGHDGDAFGAIALEIDPDTCSMTGVSYPSHFNWPGTPPGPAGLSAWDYGQFLPAGILLNVLQGAPDAMASFDTTGALTIPLTPNPRALDPQTGESAHFGIAICGSPGNGLPFTDSDTTCRRGNDYQDTCLGRYDSGEDVIYELIVIEAVQAKITIDPMGTPSTSVAIDDECPPGVSCVASSAESGSGPHGFCVDLAPGTYYIMIDSGPGQVCIPDYTLTIEDGEVSNDDCEDAMPVGEVANLPFDTSCATIDGPGGCITSPNIWYCYTATCTGEAHVSLCDSSFDTKLAVYEGCSCSPIGTMIDCIDNSLCRQASSLQSEIWFDAVAGNEYLIEVGGHDSETGTGQLDIRCIPPPPTQLKWDQPPDPAQPDNVICGWNELATCCWQNVADDWHCDTDDPVTEIRWWGSYQGWMGATPPPEPFTAFHIAIWTDVPAGGGEPFSHPGEVIYETFAENYTWEFAGWDYDPRTGEYEAAFRYEYTLSPEEYFHQQSGDNIYWLTIGACYCPGQPGPNPWGWKTRRRDPDSLAPDAAVTMPNPMQIHTGPGVTWEDIGGGAPIYWPDSASPWDMAFELIATATATVFKWEQDPDLSQLGIDVNAWWGVAYGPKVLADNFECTVTGPLVQIDIWASWLDDYLPSGDPLAVTFTLSIHEDIAEPGHSYHMPGDVLWSQTFAPGDFWVSEVVSNIEEGWLDPPDNYDFPADWTAYAYTFPIAPASAFQQQGTATDPVVYWLALQADPTDENTRLGWKTSVDHWADDAVWALGQAPYVGAWEELLYPPGHAQSGQSIDLAFAMTGQADQTYIKWSQPPEPYIPDDAYNGWNEPSMYGPNSAQIAADDWVCDTDYPVTDFHWWGSFLGWSYEDPPQLPDAFHVTIWTDAMCMPPTGGDPFSCPDVVIWENYCDTYTWQFVGWDWDPRNPQAPPEACFRFDQDLDRADWFFQDPGENIYWLSVAAVYLTPPPGQLTWGWKTRPRDPNSPAPDDAVRIFNPTEPMMGSQFIWGEPIWWPTPLESWDLAFQLTTLGCACPADMNMDGYVNGMDIQCFVNCMIHGFPMSSSSCNCACADMDGDGYLTIAGDIPAFVTELLNTTDCSERLPSIGTYSNSGCRRDSKGDPWPCTEDDLVQLTVVGDTLQTLHLNATYNCCPDDIMVSLEVDGSLLKLTEEETLTMPCPCLCCYDVNATVVNLAPGTYTVEYCWSDYETGGDRCHVEDIEIQ